MDKNHIFHLPLLPGELIQARALEEAGGVVEVRELRGTDKTSQGGISVYLVGIADLDYNWDNLRIWGGMDQAVTYAETLRCDLDAEYQDALAEAAHSLCMGMPDEAVKMALGREYAISPTQFLDAAINDAKGYLDDFAQEAKNQLKDRLPVKTD